MIIHTHTCITITEHTSVSHVAPVHSCFYPLLSSHALSRSPVRPVRLLRVSISGGLTQADS